MCEVDVREVEVVFVCGTEEEGLCRGAEEEDDASPGRARSMLKLDNRDSGGSGEEVFLVRELMLPAKGSPPGELCSADVCVCLWYTVGSMIARDREPCADVVLLVGRVELGADE